MMTNAPDYLSFLYELVKHHADVSICGSVKDDDGAITTIGNPDEELEMCPEEAIIALMWRKLYNTGFPTKLFSHIVSIHSFFRSRTI